MIIGREEEIAVLQALEKTDKSAFVAVYGRRRVGKTCAVVRKRLRFSMLG